MNLTDAKKEAIKKMLEDDIPIPIIAENLNLEDADFIYEVLYESTIKKQNIYSDREIPKSESIPAR